jgi:hypothetical protein
MHKMEIADIKKMVTFVGQNAGLNEEYKITLMRDEDCFGHMFSESDAACDGCAALVQYMNERMACKELCERVTRQGLEAFREDSAESQSVSSDELAEKASSYSQDGADTAEPEVMSTPMITGLTATADPASSAEPNPGNADPAKRLVDDDPERDKTAAVLTAWSNNADLGTDHPVTLKQVMQAASTDATLNTALLEVAPPKSGTKDEGPNPQHLGSWCRQHFDHSVDNLVLVKAGKDNHSKTTLWAVKRVAGSAGLCGISSGDNAREFNTHP